MKNRIYEVLPMRTQSENMTFSCKVHTALGIFRFAVFFYSLTIVGRPMKTAPKMKKTHKMDIPQKDTPKNVEDLSEVKRTSKCRHILRLHY